MVPPRLAMLALLALAALLVASLASLPHVEKKGFTARSFENRYMGPGRWEASWEISAPAVLVLQEAWAQGWEVRLDGGPWRPCPRVDHLLVGAPGTRNQELGT